ncbi:HAD-like domain-containing protein [Fomitopsis betulina]|nr:HAD-like domain-containing protein [Fomitopsis betulina]
MAAHPLQGVQAFIFDVFGSVVDWRTGVARELQEKLGPVAPNENWEAIAEQWRAGYYRVTAQVASGGPGKLNLEQMLRELLDELLVDDRWRHLAPHLDNAARDELTLAWHRLPGWPDSSAGLYAIKKHAIIATLSNGSTRALADMAKYADLPWDIIFSAELVGSYKPNPKTYLGAVRHLGVEPSQVCMVAAHLKDLRGAASHGLRTIFIPRSGEPDSAPETRARADGGEVDLVVKDLDEIAKLLDERPREKQSWQH